MSATAFDALVLDARLRQALVTVRSLGRRGLVVGALDTFAWPPTFFSRWCRQRFPCSALLATDEYLDYVARSIETIKPRVVIPSHDGTIALARRHRTWLEQRTALALAKESAMAIAISKERTLAVARRLRIAVPRGVVVRSVGDVPPALADIGLPAVVKPSESWHSDGESGVRVASQLVTTPDEARQAVGMLTRLGQAALFQQVLSGRREAVSLLYANGEVRARFAQWAKRTGPPLGGESVLRQSIDVPEDIGVAAERLIREIDLDGYSEVEFRRDAAGVPYLMEINPRLSASVEIAVRSGVDFPHLLYQWASGGSIDRVERYRTGVWMRYLRGDFMSTIAALRERGRPGVAPPARAVLDFCLSFFRPMAYDYVDWHDPLPAIRAVSEFARETVRACAKGKLPLLWTKAS